MSAFEQGDVSSFIAFAQKKRERTQRPIFPVPKPEVTNGPIYNSPHFTLLRTVLQHEAQSLYEVALLAKRRGNRIVESFTDDSVFDELRAQYLGTELDELRDCALSVLRNINPDIRVCRIVVDYTVGKIELAA